MLIYFYRNLIKGRCILKNVSLKTIQKDIVSGIIVALVSIPISMGYAQIAGLPAVYGLYCSILPVLIYGLITSSPQFVFGVDATPAALVGGTLATLGIASGSEEAKAVVPAITLVAALWLLLFFFIKAGRIVNYISTPVMGGFISGIGVTIILMQAAKLFGGNAGTGEAIKLLIHIAGEMKLFNLLSAVLGVGTVVIILVAKKFIPKFPMSVLLMVLGALATAIFHIDRLGVKLLPHVDKGLPGLSLPDMAVVLKNPSEIILLGLSVAGVVMATTTKEKYVLPGNGKKVALMDFGAKKNIARSLNERGCEVTVYPADTPAEEVLAANPDGIMLSNGPGDPKENVEIIKEIKKMYDSNVPIFAICLGHQLMALANGMDTYKLKYGHRGGNHPVKDLETGRVYISSQNHGYAVDTNTVKPEIAVPAFVNVNDGTNEGLKYTGKNIFTVQYHPEACPGPQDSGYLFDRFLKMMEVND